MRYYFYTLILIFTISCSQNKNVQLENNVFSISYPSNLTLDESGQEGTIFILTADEDDENDSFAENINLSTQELGDITFEEFSEKTVEQVSKVAKILENKTININGRECLSLKILVDQNDLELTFIQHYYLVNKKLFVLTFSSESSAFEDYFDEMNNVMRSFKIK